MSIQLAAKHLAAHGRGPDTTLVHMTPGEVASLQSLAQQHGGSLSINPQTGLPEAGFLSALLPMAAGAGLAAMGMPQGYAALAVGATSAATNGGNMRAAIKDGFLAYSGAGAAGAFMDAGAATTGASAAAPTVLEAPPGGSSVYSLGSPATSSTAEYSLGASNSYLNKPEYFSLASAAPAQAAQAAAAATPAAQQAAALQSMDMGQRFDALKAGATGTNAMNYIKANPFTSLGVATAAMTPDENNTPQKAADTDRGPRSKLQYYSGYGTSLPAPNMQGIEQTYNRPYYAAKGGVTRMATGGITSAPRNQQQLFADYLQRVSSSGVSGGTTPPTNKYEWWKNPNDPAPAAPAPAETAEEYAARMRVNARGGGGRGEKPEPSAWDSMTDTEKTEYYAQNPFESKMADMAGTYLSKGFLFGALGKLQDANNPGFTDRNLNILRGIHPPADSPLAGGPLVYSKEAETEPAGGPINYGPESGYMTNTDPYFNTQLGPGVGTSTYTTPEAKALNLGDTKTYIANENRYFSGVDGTAITKEQAIQELSEGKNPITIRANDSLAPSPVSDAVAQTNVEQTNAALTGSPYDLSPFADKNTAQPLSGTPALEAVGSYPLGSEDRIAADVNAGKIANGSVIGVDGKSYTVNVAQGAGGMGTSTVNLTPIGIQTQPAPAADADAVAETNAALTPAEVEAFNAFDFGPTAQAAAAAAEAEAANTAYTTAVQTERIKAAVAADIAAQDAAAADRAAAAAEAEAARSPSELAGTSALNSAYGVADAKSDAYGGGFSTNASKSYDLSGAPMAMGENKEFSGLPTSGYTTPEARPVAAPNITPSVPGAISADPNADKKVEAYNIPSAAEFAAMIGDPFAQTAALNTGVVSDASVLGGVPAPNMGNTGNIRGSFGIGGVWTNREGVPIRTGDGSLVMTGEGAAARQRAVAESNEAANRTYGNAPEGRTGRDATAGDGYGGGYGAVAPGYTGGSEAAAGGLSTPYGFQHMAQGGMSSPYDLGSYSDGGRLLRGPGDGVSDSIPATIGKGRPARLADGEFVIPARIVSEIGNGSTEAGARKLYAMMDRIQAGRKKSVGKGKVAVNSRADKYLPA